MTNELSREERAYRRGCLQALQYLSISLVEHKCPTEHLRILGAWAEELVVGRDSLDWDYLGKYLDTVDERVRKRLPSVGG